MIRGWRVLLGAAALSVVGAPGHAAPSQPPGPADGALALAALDRRIADLDSADQSDKQELSRLSSRIGASRARVIEHGKSYYKMTSNT